MTRNKLLVLIVVATLVSVALPASAFHIDHRATTSTSSAEWIAGTGMISGCEADNAAGEALMGQGGLCFAHNHTITNDADLVGPATGTAPGTSTETTYLGHHTEAAGNNHRVGQDSSHAWNTDWEATSNHAKAEWRGHADHGDAGGDDDTTQDGGFDIGVSAPGCSQDTAGNTSNAPNGDEWTALNLTIGTGTHQSATWMEDFYSAQISGVDSASVSAFAGEHFAYHEQTACLAADGHVMVFVDALAAALTQDAIGSYTTWGQGTDNPCAPGDRVCATTLGPSP